MRSFFPRESEKVLGMDIDKDLEKIYQNLPEDNKKILEDYDQRINKVMNNTPDDFFKARKNGGEIYDADILQELKLIAFAKMINDPRNNSRVLTSVSNKLCRFYERWLDTEIRLKEMKEKKGE